MLTLTVDMDVAKGLQETEYLAFLLTPFPICYHQPPRIIRRVLSAADFFGHYQFTYFLSSRVLIAGFVWK